ncbi:MAG: SPFH domain-containing protein, partial [Selenomonadaceae bacterium]|nr:SPFH domain-containing protein [Selenomonadaceae bacterium]
AMAAARIAGAQAQAMQDAARNEGGMGAMGAFMGMGMAQNAGGINAGQLFQMAGQQAQPQAAPPPSPAAGGWTCSCGHAGNTGKFCSECGKPQPAPASAWTCSCGHAGNTGKFCAECGKPKPAGPWTCSCGTQNEGKFCSNCGKPRQ